MERLITAPRVALVLTLLGLVIATGVWLFHRSSIPPIAASPKVDTEDRVAAARVRREKKLRSLSAAQGMSYPPQQILLAAFKEEGVLEVWAGRTQEPLQLFSTYPLTARSGVAGPKRREGDRQIPEGFYTIDRFNPKSAYLLSLGLNYPNEADRYFADKEHPGGDIFIHGKCASVGCLAIGDEAIEELYVLATDVCAAGQNQIPVYVFPDRMETESWKKAAETACATHPELGAFWDNLLPLYTSFVKNRRPLKVAVDPEGRYLEQPR